MEVSLDKYEKGQEPRSRRDQIMSSVSEAVSSLRGKDYPKEGMGMDALPEAPPMAEMDALPGMSVGELKLPKPEDVSPADLEAISKEFEVWRKQVADLHNARANAADKPAGSMMAMN